MPARRIICQAARRAAVAAIRRGELTVGEIAELLQINKSNVSRWCAGIDVAEARRKHMVRTWRRITAGKRLTKRDLDAQSAHADGVAVRYAHELADAAE